MSSRKGKLWVIATPIGNLGDISLRAIDALTSCEVVAAEDIKSTVRLLKLLGIEGEKRYIDLDQRCEERHLPRIIDILEQGLDVALVSEAGSPCISDPGFLLISLCRKMSVEVEVLPGPCAAIVALIASGLPPVPFTFLGFMPRRDGDRRRLLAPLSSIKSTVIFFERKSRLKDSLRVAFEVLGDREACIARELTKLHEEIIRFPLREWDSIGELRGEITVVISPPRGEGQKMDSAYIESILRQELEGNAPIKEVVDRVYRMGVGWNKKSLYALCVKIKGML